MDDLKTKDTADQPAVKVPAIQTMASKRRAMSKLDWAKGQVLNEKRDASGKTIGTSQY